MNKVCCACALHWLWTSAALFRSVSINVCKSAASGLAARAVLKSERNEDAGNSFATSTSWRVGFSRSPGQDDITREAGFGARFGLDWVDLFGFAAARCEW